MWLPKVLCCSWGFLSWWWQLPLCAKHFLGIQICNPMLERWCAKFSSVINQAARVPCQEMPQNTQLVSAGDKSWFGLAQQTWCSQEQECQPMALANKGASILQMEVEIKWLDKGHQIHEETWSLGPRLWWVQEKICAKTIVFLLRTKQHSFETGNFFPGRKNY